MSIRKNELKNELKEIFRQGHLENGKYSVLVRDDLSQRITLHRPLKPQIMFGVAQVSDNMSFSEYVHTVVDAFHEMHHCKQYWAVKRDNSVSDLAIDLHSDSGSDDYYQATYFQHYSECDAEITGIESARQYLYGKYPNHENELDRHLLERGKQWFEGAIPECVQDDNLESLLDRAKKYRDGLFDYQKPFSYEDVDASDDLIAKRLASHEKSGRISFMDNVFRDAVNGWTQRQAAFDMTVQSKKKELQKVIPALNSYETTIDKYKHYRDLPDILSTEHPYDEGKEY